MKKKYAITDLPSHILVSLSNLGLSKVTSIDIQVMLPGYISNHFNHSVMPETVARVWRMMREPGDNQVVRCSGAEKKAINGKAYTEWTIEEVYSQGAWMPWSTMLQEV